MKILGANNLIAAPVATLPTPSAATVGCFFHYLPSGQAGTLYFGTQTASGTYVLQPLIFQTGAIASTKTPDQVSGLVAWYKADALSLAAGADITSWTDSSTQANTPTGAAGTVPKYQTNQVNSLPAAVFNGTSQRLQAPSTINLGLTAGLSLFVVCKLSAALASGQLANVLNKYEGSGTNTGGYDFRLYNNGNRNEIDFVYTTNSGASGVFSVTQAVSTTGFALLEWRWDGVNVTFAYNGVQGGTAALGANAIGANSKLLNVGAFGLNNGTDLGRWFPGSIAEIALYNTGIATTDAQAVRTGLSQKYNLGF